MGCDRHIITACDLSPPGAAERAWLLEAKSVSFKSQPREGRASTSRLPSWSLDEAEVVTQLVPRGARTHWWGDRCH